jgi:tRNA pseudouridine38-40 synthase
VSTQGETRLRVTLHYDGSNYFGWQVQSVEPTVQGEVERAVQRLTGSPRTVTAAGRTDRGVHATGQVASVLLPAKWTPEAFRKALNAVLPDDIWASEVVESLPEFHPRFHAISRTYVYRLGTTELARSPFVRRYCWPLRFPIDADRLRDAAVRVIGDHSFGAFAKAGQPERGTRCTVTSAEWLPWESFGMSFRITANRYLHHMVRYLVGTMVDIAKGDRDVSEIHALLSETTDLKTSRPAPPEGLFLAHVRYPEDPPDSVSPASLLLHTRSTLFA